MYVVIAYDVADNKSRAKLHKFLIELADSTQKSMFEGDLNKREIEQIIRYVKRCLNPAADAFGIWAICRRCYRKVMISGWGTSLAETGYRVL